MYPIRESFCLHCVSKTTDKIQIGRKAVYTICIWCKFVKKKHPFKRYYL